LKSLIISSPWGGGLNITNTQKNRYLTREKKGVSKSEGLGKKKPALSGNSDEIVPIRRRKGSPRSGKGKITP